MIKIYSWFVLAIVLLIVTNVLGRFFLDFRFDFAVDVGKCIRFKMDGTDFSEAALVDDCCCVEYQ